MDGRRWTAGLLEEDAWCVVVEEVGIGSCLVTGDSQGGSPP